MLGGGGVTDAWIAEGREILARQSAGSWAFADWLAAGTTEITDRTLAEALGISDRKIGQYRATATAYPKRIRIRSLTFSHHRMAAALPEQERTPLLAAAAADGWSVSRLRTAVREASAEGKIRRQAAEIRELRRKLKAAERNAGDLLAQFRSRMKTELKVTRESGGRIAALAEDVAESADAMHGNARRGAQRDIESASETIVRDMRKVFARLEAARAAFEDDPS